MAQMKKPAPKKPMAPRTPSKGVKKPMPKILGPIKPSSPKQPMPKINSNTGKPIQRNKPGMSPKTSMPKEAIGVPTKKGQRYPMLVKPITKAPVKKKVLVMPDKISPSKMTPAQKARYLKNPERYDG